MMAPFNPDALEMDEQEAVHDEVMIRRDHLDVAASAGPSTVAIPHPKGPTKEERDLHMISHLPFQSWCECCVGGRAPDTRHKTKVEVAEREVNVIQMDYCYFGHGDKKKTIIIGTDTEAGGGVAFSGIRKGGQDEFAVKAFAAWLGTLGLSEIILQSDKENALVDFARRVSVVATPKVTTRGSPVGSHQSNGGAERFARCIEDGVRTWELHLDKVMGWKLDTDSSLFHWLPRHVAWMTTRFQVKGDGHSAFFHRCGREYT